MTTSEAIKSSPLPTSGTRAKVLIVDNDLSMRNLLQTILKDKYVVYTAFGSQSAAEIMAHYDIDVVLLDIRLGNDNGIDILKTIKNDYERTEVIMITVVKDIRTAVDAIKYGAFDYINKDFNGDELKLIIEQALKKQQMSAELNYLRNELRELTDFKMVIGHSPQMKEIELIIKRIAKTPSNILIQGESGTGKEVVARKIHELGQVSKNPGHIPFVSVNVASIPSELIESILFGHEKGSFTGAHKLHKGKFEMADGGTLFLDEIGELRFDLQTKILRALQERQIDRVGGSSSITVNVRIIAATNKNLLACVKQGTFREDLYYRLNVIPINMPPLRERLEDLPEFVGMFLNKYSEKLKKRILSYDPEVMESFHTYSWPGNIRELENIIERMVALCESDKLVVDDVPLEVRFSGKATQAESPTRYEDLLREATSAFEKRFILSALNRQGWNQVKTAGELGIHRKTLEYKIKKLKLHALIEEKKRPRDKQIQRTP